MYWYDLIHNLNKKKTIQFFEVTVIKIKNLLILWNNKYKLLIICMAGEHDHGRTDPYEKHNDGQTDPGRTDGCE